MRQVMEDGLGNRQLVVLNDDVDVGCQVDGEATAARRGQMSITGKFAFRPATRLWIGAALLATAWSSEVRGSSETSYPGADARARAQLQISEPGSSGSVGDFDIESAQSKAPTAKPVRLAQAAPIP